ncbi:putative urea ABC transporter substrate-binding protein [Phenylobacterium sp. LjRoot225]|uniref:putative urea ABC transporter substrate-binding protein n=1 Tax=Phenylobacterium sp. LjRoot225 TaxID=3342285 RepID=UPI003ECFEEAE
MHPWLKTMGVAAATAAVGLSLASCSKPATNEQAAAPAAADKEYQIGWTIYAGWMPWPYAQQAGIVQKWADKYNVKIKLVQINDYVESLNQFTAGKLDGVTSTNMDALTIPAAGGRDSTVVMVGDYSNGNDGVVLKNGKTLADIKGRSVNIVSNSVSQYLLARCLENAGMKTSDVKLVNTSDADMVSAFAAPGSNAMVTWNPMLMEIKKAPGASEVCASTNIPAEIEDMVIVSTDVLKANPNLGKALAGIWYETMSIMTKDDAAGKAAREAMAKLSGTDLAGFDAQLKTTFLYADPKAAEAFTKSQQLVDANDKVRKFSFENGLFGQGAKSVDDIGIEFPGGKILGNPQNVKLRFDPTYVSAAAAGTL